MHFLAGIVTVVTAATPRHTILPLLQLLDVNAIRYVYDELLSVHAFHLLLHVGHMSAVVVQALQQPLLLLLLARLLLFDQLKQLLGAGFSDGLRTAPLLLARFLGVHLVPGAIQVNIVNN